MHFGLFCLMTQRQKDKRPADIYRETVEQVQMAERGGFHIAWFAEHHFSNYCLCPSPMTMTTYMAAKTSTIKLGPAVIVAPLYEPIRLVEDIGVADQISGGRVVLGFGTGYQEYEFHKFGRDLKQSRSALFEVLDFLDACLAGEPVAFKGERINLPETHFSVRMLQSRPSIYLAGMATDVEAQRRAVQRAYTPFFTTGWNDTAVVQKIRDEVGKTYAQAGGDASRMPFAIQRYVYVTDHRDDALKAADGARYVRRIAMAMRNKYGELEGAFLKETPAADEPSLEEIATRLPIGDPHTVAERLARDIDALGPSHVSLFMAIPGLSQAQILASMERFAGEVIPLLEQRFGDLGRLGYDPSARTSSTSTATGP